MVLVWLWYGVSMGLVRFWYGFECFGMSWYNLGMLGYIFGMGMVWFWYVLVCFLCGVGMVLLCVGMVLYIVVWFGMVLLWCSYGFGMF